MERTEHQHAIAGPGLRARGGERGGDISCARRIRGDAAGEVRSQRIDVLPARARVFEPGQPPAIHGRGEPGHDAGGVLVRERGEHREHAPPCRLRRRPRG
jgi:hypothetical protein